MQPIAIDAVRDEDGHRDGGCRGLDLRAGIGTGSPVTAHRRPEIRFSDAPRGTCRWCGEAIVHGSGPQHGEPNRRRRWHPECVDVYNATDPREVRKRLRRRDRGVCARCGLDTIALRRELAGRGMTRKLRARGFVPRRSLWEVDHVVPLIDGGSHGLDNLQTLCTPCHKTKTAEEARARAARTPRPPDPPVAAASPPPTAPAPLAAPEAPASDAPPRRATKKARRRRVQREEPLAHLLERASHVNARVETLLRDLRPAR
jgi:5-methylcytosine-specific restriction endonuclease McrA